MYEQPSKKAVDDRWSAFTSRYVGDGSYMMQVSNFKNNPMWTIGEVPDQQLYTASAFKAFVLAECLRQVELGQVSLAEELRITDDVKSFARDDDEKAFANKPDDWRESVESTLEAMIGWSDNTATDMILRRIKPVRVREFIGVHRFQDVIIPDSLRRHFLRVYGKDPDGFYTYEELRNMRDHAPLKTSPFEVSERMAAPTSAFVQLYHHATTEPRRDADEYLKTNLARDAFVRILESSEPAKKLKAGLGARALQLQVKGGRLDLPPYHVGSSAGRIVFGDDSHARHFLDFAIIFNTAQDTNHEEGFNERMFHAFVAANIEMLKVVINHDGWW
jgi:hypothetical protein